MPLPANNQGPLAEQSLIAGSVLPIQRAEELLATLPGVISARIVASLSGAVEEIHILTTTEVAPKQTVRNVESALIAHLGMHVSHKKISVATSDQTDRSEKVDARASRPPAEPVRAEQAQAPAAIPASVTQSQGRELVIPVAQGIARRRIYFEDVEVRRSRTKGIACRVSLRKGDEVFVGEAEGLENERLRIELASRATIAAIRQAEGDERLVALEGYRMVDAFDREFVFVGVTSRVGRETIMMTGSAEVRESPETAAVLAVLDATNRWLER